MPIRIAHTPPPPPARAACLFGNPVRAETIRAFAECLQHLAVVRTRRAVHHIVNHSDSDAPLQTAPSGARTHRTRWKLGPLARTLVVGVRYQAARPKDGDSEAEMTITLLRLSDAEVIDGAALTPAHIVADPDNAPAFPPRWVWLTVDPIAGPGALDVTGQGGEDVELAVAANDVRVLTIVAHEIVPRQVG